MRVVAALLILAVLAYRRAQLGFLMLEAAWALVPLRSLWTCTRPVLAARGMRRR